MQSAPPAAGAVSAEQAFESGAAAVRAGDLAVAADRFGNAIAIRPEFWPAWLERGRIRILSQDWPSAVRDLEAASRLVPSHGGVWLDLGRALHGLGDVSQARGCFLRAAAAKPGLAEARYNLAILDFQAGDLTAAIAQYSEAIRLKPDFYIARSNLAVTLEAAGQPEKALEVLEQAITISPDDPAAYWNKALLLLRQGDYEAGWKLYEWRWAAGKAGVCRRYAGRPLWLGGVSVRGKTVLVHAEQGLGDTIEFVRYMALLCEAGARIVLEVQPHLVALCRRLEGVAEVVDAKDVANGARVPAFDLHVPLMSLPLVFGTTLETIPGRSPYIAPDTERLARWTERLGARTCPRVGLVWRGNPRHDADAWRSMPFEQMHQMLVPGIDFVSFQKDTPPGELAALAADTRIRSVADALDDFEDTCAAIACCDVVISVDTAVAHLAGAMGKPVWIALPHRAEWRWMRDRTDSPWYPSAVLLRQERQGDWSSLIGALRERLAALVASR